MVESRINGALLTWPHIIKIVLRFETDISDVSNAKTLTESAVGRGGHATYIAALFQSDGFCMVRNVLNECAQEGVFFPNRSACLSKKGAPSPQPDHVVFNWRALLPILWDETDRRVLKREIAVVVKTIVIRFDMDIHIQSNE